MASKSNIQASTATGAPSVTRCEWCGDDPLYQAYHDEEWGVPVFDDQTLFEFLTLEGAQAGLAWITILRKREGYREAFKGFDPEAVARMNQRSVTSLMKNPEIVRNRLKIESTLTNAKAFLKLQDEEGSFSGWLWSFVDHTPIQNRYKKLSDIPAKTELSDQVSKALKKRGFKFVGSTICYAFMQATGMTNDHITSCHRYAALKN